METMKTTEPVRMDPVSSRQKPHARAYTPEEIDQMPGLEVVDKRTSTGKLFSLGGNLFQSILYSDPVHYLDKKTGRWEEIDNTLIPVVTTQVIVACGSCNLEHAIAQLKHRHVKRTTAQVEYENLLVFVRFI